MIKKGDIVIVAFPFTDLSSDKVRPVLVVSDGVIEDDVTVAFMSSKKTSKKSPYNTIIKMTLDNKLKQDSVVKCYKLSTLDKKMILGQIGKVSDDDMKRVDACLRKSFGL